MGTRASSIVAQVCKVSHPRPGTGGADLAIEFKDSGHPVALFRLPRYRRTDLRTLLSNQVNEHTPRHVN